jgi:hypothetical protein
VTKQRTFFNEKKIEIEGSEITVPSHNTEVGDEAPEDNLGNPELISLRRRKKKWRVTTRRSHPEESELMTERDGREYASKNQLIP